jgi:outer membrane receptor protein involved in Fe transport
MKFAAALAGGVVLIAPAAAAPAAIPSAAPALEEVVVTATRRELPLLQVPLSVHAITEDEIALSGARNFRDYANAVAGVSFSDVGYADAKVTIRGISTDIFVEVRPLTATYLDETPVTHPGSHPIAQSDANPELVDLERVEILRGPQGTLYGASSMGGAVRIVTHKPDPKRSYGYAETILSSTDHGGFNYEIDLIGNLALGNETAMRLGAFYRDADGFIDNVGTGQDNANAAQTYGARVGFSKSLNDRLHVFAALNYQEQHADGFNMDQVILPRYQQFTDVDQFYEDEWTLPSLLVTYDFAQAQLLSSTAWIDRRWRQFGDISGINAQFGTNGLILADQIQELREFVQEFRVASTGTDGLQWLAGLFLNDRDQAWIRSFPAPGFDVQTGGAAADAGVPDNLGIGRTDWHHRQIAVFGELGIPFSQRFRADIGARWFKFDETGRDLSDGLLGGEGIPVFFVGSQDSGFSPKVSVSWFPVESSIVYATVANGYRPGGSENAELPDNFDELCGDELAELGITNVPLSTKPDSLWSYELGGRTTGFGGRLQASVSAYHIDWTDIQLLAFLECGYSFEFNGGKAESDGMELEFTAFLTDSLKLAFGGAYIDAHLTEDLPTTGAPAGSKLPGVAQLSWNVSVDQRIEFGQDRTLFAYAGFRYVDESVANIPPPGQPLLGSPAYEIVDLRIGFETSNWAVSLFAQNLLDEYAIVNFVDDGGLNVAGDWNNIIRPRTIGLDVRVNFD